MSAIKSFGLVILLLLVVLVYASFFMVNEGQQALKLRLGEIVTSPGTGIATVYDPGLHFKVPFLNQVRDFDVRLQTLSVDSTRVLTQRQRYLLIDYYAKWRISNLPLFYTRTGGSRLTAETLLQQKINDALRAAVGKRTITQVVSSQRADIMQAIRTQVDESAENLGVTVIDVRIKGIDLPQEVTDSVYQRMSTKREQAATKHRSDGKANAEKIRAEADANVTMMLAQTRAQAAEIRAQGLAIAAKIYADAYGKDANFYAFYRSLQAYQNSFNKKGDVLVLQPDSQFFQYFNSAAGEKKAG